MSEEKKPPENGACPERVDGVCYQVRHTEDPPPPPTPLPPLTRESILGADDLPLEEVRVEEWQGTVRVRTLTGKERDEFEQTVQNSQKGPNKFDIRGVKVKLLILTVCDEHGTPLFKDSPGQDDMTALNEKSSRVIDRLFQVAQRVNGLTAEAVDELLGNS